MRFVFDEFVLDDRARELLRHGEAVAIGDQAMSLLLHLLLNRDRVVPREELHEVLWSGAAIGETSLGQAVRHARRALGRDGGAQRFIRNVRGRGYRFAAEVQEQSGTAAEAGAPARAIAPAERAPAFFGREKELGAIEGALKAALSGRGDAVWIAGPEGVGKTRLLEEAARLASVQGARVLRGGCADGGWTAPYEPFAEIIAATRHDPTARTSWAGADAEWLKKMCDPAAVGAEHDGATRDRDRARIFEATISLFRRLVEGAPLVLLLDDLHWADPATLALTHRVVRAARAGPWLIVGAFRDDPREHLEPDRLAALQRLGERRSPIRLDGLQTDETAHLLEAQAGRPLPEQFVSDVHAETGGNPFFAREILRHLLDEGSLVDDAGHWRSDVRLDAASLPAGVREVVSRRLAGLGPAARELLTVAAAARGSFHFEVVRRAAQIDEPAALDGLDEALDANMVSTTGEADVYDFSHDLARHVLYDEQSPARRVRLHRRLAEALVAVQGSRSHEHAERIARHYHSSAELPGAEAGVGFCVAAADRAMAVAAWEDEASFVEMALDLQAPDDRERYELLQRRGVALAFSGSTAEAARIASEATKQLEERAGRGVAADYLVNLVTAVAWGSSELAFDLTEHARDIVGEDDPLTLARLRLIELWRDASLEGHPLDTPEQRQATLATLDSWSSLDASRKNALALVGLAFESREEVLERAGDTAAFLALWAGEYERAIPMFRDDIAAAGTHAEIAGTYFYQLTISSLHAALGRLDEARSAYTEVERQPERLPPAATFRIIRASARSEIARAQGRGFEDLVPLFEELVLGVDDGSKWLMPTAMCCGAEMFALAGREEEARRMLEAGLPGMIRSPGWMTSFTLMVNTAIGTIWALGSDEWAPLLEKQLQEKTLAPDFRFPGTDSRLSMARLCTLQERYEEAESWFDEARRVLEEQGAAPLRAITDLDEARMRLRRDDRGDRELAAALLRKADSAFREIGMPGWIERAAALDR